MSESLSTELVMHTPGPWKAAAARSSIVGLPIVAAGGRAIANSHQPGEEGMANARLIAAAPDLLASLKRAAHELERYVDLQKILDYIEYAATTQKELDAVNDTIAKAEGRS